MNKLFRVLLCLLLILAGAACGYLAAVSHVNIASDSYHSNNPVSSVIQGNQTASNSDAVKKAGELKNLIDSYFVGDFDEGEMGDAVAEAMISATGDRWSYYISAADYESYLEQMNNSYVGIGVTIQLGDNGCEIVSVTKDSPAYRAGIRVQDILTAVNGESVDGWSLTDIKDHVKGPENTSVTLTFLREGAFLDFGVLRETIDTPVAEYELLNGHIGYIRINNFDSKCAKETLACISSALEDGADSLIFDVRFNPGGYKTELVEILDYLLPEGELFRMIDYSGKESVDYSDADYLDVPMAVLINRDSYSAAEFFAAALQEYGAARIVGEQTCGKGYFQYTYQLSDGSAAAISSGTYYTPNGISLAGVGITPDIPVEIPDEDYLSVYYGTMDHEADQQLQAAIEAFSAAK